MSFNDRRMTSFSKKSTRAARLPLLFLLLSLLACSNDRPEVIKLAGATMGTTYHISLVVEDGEIDSQVLQASIDQRLESINLQMSTYISESEISHFNREPPDQWFYISDDFFKVLQLSMEISWLSNGAFDPSIGPLVNLWGFGPKQQGAPQDQAPSEQAIAAALSQVDFRALVLDLAENKILKKKPIVIDLSAFAKGYAVDQVAELLEGEGFSNYMVEIGGELRLSGNSPRGGPWRIAIEEPVDGAQQLHRAIELTNKAVATSGDYRNYFEQDGKHYSHTIDPTTGRPVVHRLVSVTVISDTAAEADALATAVLVLGEKAGYKMAQDYNLAVYIIYRREKGLVSQSSDAFAAYLD